MPATVITADVFTGSDDLVTNFSYTVPNMSALCNRLLIIVRHGQNTNGITHSAVQFNSDAATMLTLSGDNYIDCQTSGVNQSRRRFSVWYLDAPDTGTNLNVTGTYSAQVAWSSVTVIPLQDADTSAFGAMAQLEAQASATAMDTAITPTDADGLILYLVTTAAGTAAPFAIADATDTELVDGAASNHSYFVGSGDVVSVGNPQTMGVDATTGNVWGSLALEILPGSTPINVDVLPATEAEVANPITPVIPREVAVGTVAEAELAQPISAVLNREVAVGTATEVEVGQPFGVLINRNIDVGTATEVELGQTITPAMPREVPVGTATEVELGLTITPETAGPPGCSVVDVVGWQMADGRPFAWTSWGTFGPGFIHPNICVVGPISVTINPATERELAQPITPSIPREVAVGTAVERELANVIDPQVDRNVPVGTATERELAQPITPTIGRAVLIGTATEVELGREVTPLLNRRVVIGTATEVELARFISPVKPILVPVQTAVERELARVMTPFQGEPYIPIVDCDILTLGVDCEVSAVGVDCAILSLDVECELVDAYGQNH